MEKLKINLTRQRSDNYLEKILRVTSNTSKIISYRLRKYIGESF